MRNTTPCGENGEFDTFVFDGPMFDTPVKFPFGEIVWRGTPWFWDLLPASSLCSKEDFPCLASRGHNSLLFWAHEDG
jgi:hypothetical protein